LLFPKFKSMPNFSTVIQLVQSLTQSEKRNFKLITGLQEGNKAYKTLYDLMIKYSGAEKSVLQEFSEKLPGTDINSTINYLYSVIIRSLLILNQRAAIDEQLLTGIQEARILFRKGLINEGFSVLAKLRKLALSNEKNAYCLIIDKLELHYHNRFQYQNVNENELLKIQSRLRKNLNYELNLTDHSSLYELLNYRYINQGSARSQRDKEKLNDLVMTEMNLAGNQRFQSFDLKKNHLLFQSVYFMMTGDNKSSLQTFYELNSLFEEYRQLWSDAPIYYIHHLRGILNNLHTTGQFAAMDFFIAKLGETGGGSPMALLHQTTYVANLKKFLGLKRYAEAADYIDSQKDFLGKLQQLTQVNRAETILYTAITYYYNKQIRQAAKLLRSVIHLGNLPNKQLLRVLRLINLIVHFELHDFDYLISEVRSLEREMKLNTSNYPTETVLLKLFKKYPQAMSKSARKKLFEASAAELQELKDDPFERQLFMTFDFADWASGMN